MVIGSQVVVFFRNFNISVSISGNSRVLSVLVSNNPVVNNGSQDSTNNGADPEDPVVSPVITDDSRAENSGRVQTNNAGRGNSEGSNEDDTAQSKEEGINGNLSAENNGVEEENVNEGEKGFVEEGNAVSRVGRDVGETKGVDTSGSGEDGIRGHPFKDKSTDDSTDKLESNVKETTDDVLSLSNNSGDSNGGV